MRVEQLQRLLATMPQTADVLVNIAGTGLDILLVESVHPPTTARSGVVLALHAGDARDAMRTCQQTSLD